MEKEPIEEAIELILESIIYIRDTWESTHDQAQYLSTNRRLCDFYNKMRPGNVPLIGIDKDGVVYYDNKGNIIK